MQVVLCQHPSLVNEPQSVERSDGEEAVLDCKFDAPAKECVWLKDGEITIIREPYQYVGSPDTGDCSVRITQVDLGRDDGSWQCQYPRLGNFPAVISKAATLTVLVAPEDPIIFFDGEVIEKGGTLSLQRLGENVTVVCLSKNGNPASGLHWEIDGRRLEGSLNQNESIVGPNNLRAFNSQSQLTLLVVGSELRGSQIKCIAEHPTYHGVLHETYANFQVHHNTTLVSASVDGLSVTSVQVDDQQEVTVYCSADGVPEPSYMWEFQNKGENGWEVMGNRQNLTFNAKPGRLICKAGNEYNMEHVRAPIEIVVDTKAPTTQKNGDSSIAASSLLYFHLVLFAVSSRFLC